MKKGSPGVNRGIYSSSQASNHHCLCIFQVSSRSQSHPSNRRRCVLKTLSIHLYGRDNKNHYNIYIESFTKHTLLLIISKLTTQYVQLNILVLLVTLKCLAIYRTNNAITPYHLKPPNPNHKPIQYCM